MLVGACLRKFKNRLSPLPYCEGMGQKKAPKCHDCQHFYVSWDKKFPMGCNYLGFKGKHLPSMEVLAATGKQCCWFKAKHGCQSQCQPQEPQVEVILPPGCSLSITA